MSTNIKICGLQSVEVIKSVLNLPFEYAGFVFAPSRRQVTIDQAKQLNEVLPPDKKSVGVFVHPTIEELDAVLSEVSLDVVQLHGEEDGSFCREIKQKYGVQVWKALSVKGDVSPEHKLAPYLGVVDAILLDTYDPHAAGGIGVTFPWEHIPRYRKLTDEAGIPLFIAGGLQEDNVGELIEQYAPPGLDVSSGVETNGMKDTGKIKRFVERVRDYGDRA